MGTHTSDLRGSDRSGGADSAAQVRRVVIDTALGAIEVLLELARAPISAGDFLKYVDRGLYAGGAFYRAVRPNNDPQPIKIEVLQGGLTDDSKFLDPIALIRAMGSMKTQGDFGSYNGELIASPVAILGARRV